MPLTQVLPCVTCPALSVYPLHLLLTYRTGSDRTGEGARLSADQRTHLVSFRSQASSLPVCWMRRTQGNLLRLGNAMPQSSWGCTPYYTWAAGRFHLECRFSLTAGKENQLDWFQVTAAVALPCLGVLQTAVIPSVSYESWWRGSSLLWCCNQIKWTWYAGTAQF